MRRSADATSRGFLIFDFFFESYIRQLDDGNLDFSRLLKNFEIAGCESSSCAFIRAARSANVGVFFGTSTKGSSCSLGTA